MKKQIKKKAAPKIAAKVDLSTLIFLSALNLAITFVFGLFLIGFVSDIDNNIARIKSIALVSEDTLRSVNSNLNTIELDLWRMRVLADKKAGKK